MQTVEFVECSIGTWQGERRRSRLSDRPTERESRSRLRQDAVVAHRLDQLTQREMEVLELIIAGRLNKQIADDLGISIKTVEVHRARVMEKMEANSLAELVQSVMTCEAARGRFIA